MGFGPNRDSGARSVFGWGRGGAGGGRGGASERGRRHRDEVDDEPPLEVVLTMSACCKPSDTVLVREEELQAEVDEGIEAAVDEEPPVELRRGDHLAALDEALQVRAGMRLWGADGP